MTDNKGLPGRATGLSIHRVKSCGLPRHMTKQLLEDTGNRQYTTKNKGFNTDTDCLPVNVLCSTSVDFKSEVHQQNRKILILDSD